jgi:hypothetical protein
VRIPSLAFFDVAPATLARSASKGILGKNACIECPSLARRASVCGKNDAGATSKRALRANVDEKARRKTRKWR